MVTGGSSAWDSQAQESVSLVDGSVIPQRDAGSAHHLIRGGRDVDIRGNALGDITPKQFKAIVRQYTDFSRGPKLYKDGHYHMGLKNIESNYCRSPIGC